MKPKRRKLPPEEVEPQGVPVDLESHEPDSSDLPDFVESDGHSVVPVQHLEGELTGHVSFFGLPTAPRCLEEEVESPY